MILIPLILIVGFITFLYIVFVLAKDDFILLRKNVSLEQLFNISFIGGLITLLGARIGYVIDHPSKDYLNPLVFFIFPYFPGLSLAGAIVAVCLFLFLVGRRKLPIGRIFDIFFLAIIGAVSLAGIIQFLVVLLLSKKLLLLLLLQSGFAGILFIFFQWLFGRSTKADGSIGLLGITLFAVGNSIFAVVTRGSGWMHIQVEEILFALIALILFILFIRQEHLHRKTRKK